MTFNLFLSFGRGFGGQSTFNVIYFIWGLLISEGTVPWAVEGVSWATGSLSWACEIVSDIVCIRPPAVVRASCAGRACRQQATDSQALSCVCGANVSRHCLLLLAAAGAACCFRLLLLAAAGTAHAVASCCFCWLLLALPPVVDWLVAAFVGCCWHCLLLLAAAQQ